MQTKTYFASSVPAALEVARQELGDNAMLIGSRPTPQESRGFGRLEVTFAHEESRQTEPGDLSGMEDIRAELAALRKAVGSERSTKGEASGLLTERILESGESSAVIVRDLAERIHVAPFGEMRPGESRTLAFIGPPGRGKTTSLVKIAVQYGLARRVPVRIYSAGAHAIGGQEQMARYASILGATFQACESLAGLNLALNGDGWKGLLLIDTPGLSWADRDEFEELRRFLASHPEIEKHLVLRADAGAGETAHMLSRFAPLTPSRLLFTGLDEALRPIAAVETLITSGLATTFCGTGQQIPDDLEEVDASRLARAVAGAAAPVAPRFRQAAA
jgi:flagellar biosynthesis protein FlhF